jgi:hypothetical protein
MAARGSHGLGLMLLQQTKTSTEDLGFVVEPSTGNAPIDQFLKVWRKDFAHAGNMVR